MQKIEQYTGAPPPIRDNYIRHAISPLTDEEKKILMAPVIAASKKENKSTPERFKKDHQK